MKHFLAAVLLFSAAVTMRAQSPQAPDPQLAALIKEVQAQQAQIADNQTKLNEKMALVAEAVRVARIWASRGR
jgi:hypothetical protein